MKKLLVFILILLFIPFLRVDALKCYGEVIDLKGSINNFECTDINGDSLTFKKSENGQDISSKFKVEISESKRALITFLDKNITFSSSKKNGEIKISDGSNDTIILIKNEAYIPPSTTTKITTTVDENVVTLTVSLDPLNGNDIIKKTCEVTSNNTMCSITLPKLEGVNFNGWGTQETCKEGKSGTIRVDKDITYYACYKNNTNDNTTTTKTISTTVNDADAKGIYLKTLSLVDKTTEQPIDFGIFSIKKYEYDFKVLYEVENIDIVAEAEENIKIEISGNENLVVGENKITIKLIDKENNEKEYVLNVTRLNEGETINEIPFLKSLVIGGYNINFNKEQFIYNLTIPSDLNKLEINYEVENESSKVEVFGNESLADGSVIKISVSNDSGEPIYYLINITKESEINFLLIGAVSLIVVLVIVLVVLIIIKSNKNKKNKSNNVKTQKESVEVLNI